MLEILVGSQPGAYRIGDLIYAPRITPVDPATDKTPAEFEAQLEQALGNMRDILQRADAGLENVAHVTVYFKDVAWRPRLNTVWEQWFPDPKDRPPHKYVPVPFTGDIVTELQVYAFAGARRRVLEIPGISHQDPMAMGVEIAGHIFSSRLFAADPATGRSVQGLEAQTEVCLGNMERLLENAGAAKDALSQVKAFVKDPADAGLLSQRLEEMFAGHPPAIDVLVTDLPGLGIRLEIMGGV